MFPWLLNGRSDEGDEKGDRGRLNCFHCSFYYILSQCFRRGSSLSLSISSFVCAR